MSILIDSSIWIEYFRNGNNYEKVDFLVDENLVVTNDLILAELTPFLMLKRQNTLIELLQSINKLRLDIQWDQIAKLQYQCLQNGLNGVGIPDLIIIQNTIQNGSKIYSLDKHFSHMNDFLNFEIF